MTLSIVCEGGPAIYAGRVWDDVEADDAGYVLLPRPGEDGPEAWYRVDDEADPVQTTHGFARRARYVAEYLPS